MYKLSCLNWIFTGFNELWSEIFLNGPVTAKIAVPFFPLPASPHASSARSLQLSAFARLFRVPSLLCKKGLLAIYIESCILNNGWATNLF